MDLLELYVTLFYSFFKIGLFGFGGGYAMLSLVQHEVVVLHKWLSMSDFTDIVAISQTTPGPIAFNSATYVGYTAVVNSGFGEMEAVLGSAICTLAVSAPSLILMTLVCLFFARLQGNAWMKASLSILKPAVIGFIAAAAFLLMTPYNFVDYKSWIIFGLVLVASYKKINPILLLILSGGLGLLLYG